MHPRIFFLDWLRIAAFLVLVLFHVGMYYVPWTYHVKSQITYPGLAPWMLLSAPWRMDLIFMVSGAATALMLQSGASLALLRQRAKFILLPLLCGIILIVPPQSYLEVVQKDAYGGEYLDFLKLYFSRYKGFCGTGPCLILPTWNHLWFLPYLFVYTVLLWSLVRFFPTALDALARKALKVLPNGLLLITPITLIILIRLTLVERFPANLALVGDWFNHTMYFSMFLWGALFSKAPSAWLRLEQWRWLVLTLAIGCWLILVSLQPAKPLEHIVVAAMQWSAVMAAFAFAHRHLNFDGPWRQTLTEAVFPVYIFHQTVLLVFSQLLAPLNLAPQLEAPMLITLTFVLSYAAYLLVRQVEVLRPWFGLRSNKQGT